jgi:hypothetical protein
MTAAGTTKRHANVSDENHRAACPGNPAAGRVVRNPAISRTSGINNCRESTFWLAALDHRVSAGREDRRHALKWASKCVAMTNEANTAHITADRAVITATRSR